MWISRDKKLGKAYYLWQNRPYWDAYLEVYDSCAEDNRLWIHPKRIDIVLKPGEICKVKSIKIIKEIK